MMFFKNRSEKANIFEKVPLFSNLSRRHRELIASQADEVQAKAGKTLARQGEQGLEFIIIIAGQARVEKSGRIIAHLGVGDYFGEISLIDGKARTATVIAETPMTLLVIHKRSFSYLLDKVPGLERKMLLSLCSMLRQAEESIHD